MHQASTARALLRRLHPWIGKAVHSKWTVRRLQYREESEQLLLALSRSAGAYVPAELQARLDRFLTQLYREWFPGTWREKAPTYAEMLHDFRWWLNVAERWNEKPAKPKRVRKAPASRQPEALLKRLGLPANCSQQRFVLAWRRFVKTHHPDLNPDQTAEERRRFAEVVALRRR